MCGNYSEKWCYTGQHYELLIRLKLNGVGCHIGNQFAGAPAYADDVILLSPSLTGLQNMLDVCKIYSNEFFIDV